MTRVNGMHYLYAMSPEDADRISKQLKANAERFNTAVETLTEGIDKALKAFAHIPDDEED